MSLFTPPSTAHRISKDKENREIDPSSRVIFAKDHKIHILASPTHSPTLAHPQKLLAVPKVAAGRSILKKHQSIYLTPFDEDEPQREVTPEPSDPLCDLVYLEYPVSVITRPEGAQNAASLRDLIEAYSVLTARLRACVTGTTDVDASWPLFQPLRKQRHAFVSAVVRDLGKALVNPASGTEEEERERQQAQRVLLPSPKNTPKKKRDGMTAEQVKRARDLCTTSHAVIRLLSLVFTLPAICSIFSDNELHSMLTGVLAIPLADDLPTLNARKTCALAIWLIQTQRLPPAVLAPAADRIAFALTRGIDGELGKEGKKGSASDGLKAVHDLSIHAPSIFVPAFINAVLPSVLSNLLAPTLTLRTLACHALGGFVLGTLEVPPRPEIHTRISDIVSEYFMRVPPPKPTLPSPTKSTSPSKTITATATPSAATPLPSPSKPTPSEPAIIRTLRTTLQATEPAQVAHGPVWALLVMAALMMLMNERVVRDGRIGRAMSGLVSLAMRHRKASVRGLACLVWRVLAWAWCQPRLPVDSREGEEEIGDEEGEDKARKESARERKGREQWWELVVSVPELEMGVCTVVALLGGASGCDGWRSFEGAGEGVVVKKVLEVMKMMTQRDGKTGLQALDVLKQLVGVGRSRSSRRRRECDEEQDQEQGDSRKPSLVPRPLFSALPGLLSVDFKSLGSAVDPIFDETPKAEDVRSLTREELVEGWTGFVRVWRGVLGSAGVWTEGAQPKKGKGEDADGEVWNGLVGIWEGLVGMRVGALQDEADEEALCEFATTAVDVIIDSVLQDETLDLNRELPRLSISLSPSFSGNALKLRFARALWGALRNVFPQPVTLAAAGERLLASLMKNAGEYTYFDAEVEFQTNESGNDTWAEFCVDVLAVCGPDAMRAFWGYPDMESGEKLWTWGWGPEERASVWRVFCARWMEVVEGEWEGGIVVLGVPFLYDSAWELSKPHDGAWHALLDHSVNKALDYGHDSGTVLACLASTVLNANQAAPTAASSCVQLVEFLMSHISGAHDKGEEMREIPESVLELVNETMGAAYPPAPREKTRYLWASRAVMEVVEKCPPVLGESTLVGDVIKGVVEGVAVWIEDETEAWSVEDLEYDIVPLYQIILVRIQELPVAMDTLKTFAVFIGCPFNGRQAVREMCVQSFREFWEATYAQFEEPEDGWPEEIQTCLEAVFTSLATKGEWVQEVSCSPTPSLFTPPTLRTIPAPLPPSCSAFKLVPALWTPDACPDSASPSMEWTMPTRPTTPTTPTAGSRFSFPLLPQAGIVTPPRPQKPPVNFNFLTQLPAELPSSPVRAPGSVQSSRHPQTPRRTPRSVGRGESPSKRRKVEDKENEKPDVWMSPARSGRIRSVAERIEEVCGSGGRGSGKTLGKRRSFNRAEEEVGARPSPLKKGRKAEAEESEDEEDNAGKSGEDDVFGTKPTVPNFATFYVGPTRKPIHVPLPPALALLKVERQEKEQPQPSRKRKRVIMDAVEVPTLREVYGSAVMRFGGLRSSVSFDSGLKMRTPRSASVKEGVAKRTRSATKNRCADALASCSAMERKTKENRRRAVQVSSSDGFEDGSDPIELRPGLRRVASQPASSSSDDDPHLGQVTPHHLISPDLKKSARGLGRFYGEGEPGSDDSVPSPSKEIVERKLRMESFTKLKPLVF